MSDFQVRSDNVDVEQIMRQIRARIRDKRGVDYTEDEIRELANVKLEKFLDPKGVRSDLLQQYRAARETSDAPSNYAFEDSTLYASSRPALRFMRRLLHPLLKLFFNPNPLIEALHIQSRLNDSYNRSEALYYELVHNLVLETTRLGLEVKNLKMRLESVSSRLDFDERRARALEGVVQYRPGSAVPLQPPAGAGAAQPPAPGSHNELDTEGNERRQRRRRRRGRRRGAEDRGAASAGSAQNTGYAAPGPRPEGQPGAPAHQAGERTSAPAPSASSAPESSGGHGETSAGPDDARPADDDQ